MRAGDTADIHQRTLSAMVDLEQEYRKCYLNNRAKFEHLIIDVNDGGCPKAAALEILFERCTEVLTILNDVKNDNPNRFSEKIEIAKVGVPFSPGSSFRI